MPTHSPTWFDWITVLALLAGPVLALSTQRILDLIREKKKRRYNIYLTLMSLRATPLHSDHIKALNTLDTVFDGDDEKDTKVREAWEKMLAQVNTKREGTEEQKQAWDTKVLDSRVDIYQAVGRAVGYDHSIDYIKQHVYLPTYYNDIEFDQIKDPSGSGEDLDGEWT